MTKRKSVSWLMVPEGEEFTMVGCAQQQMVGMAAGTGS